MIITAMNSAAFNKITAAKYFIDSFVKFFVGVFLCLNPLTAPLIDIG